jgi:hypothetical protein
MAKKITWKPSLSVVRSQNAVKNALLILLEKSGNNNQPLDRQGMTIDEIREVRQRGIPVVFKRPDLAAQVFAEGSKLGQRILNSLRDTPTLEGFVNAVDSRKLAGEGGFDAVETLSHLEEDAIDRGIFDSAVEFHRYLTDGGRGVSRIANAVGKGEITDEEALTRMNDQRVALIRKQSMAFDTFI